MKLRFPILAGMAVSVLVHLGLAGGLLLLAEVRPFADVVEQQIEVDVVTADEAPPVPEPKPEAAPETRPALDLPQEAPVVESRPAAPPPEPVEAQPQQQQPNEPSQPQMQAEAAAPPQSQPPAKPPFPEAIPQQPDITVKYAVSLGLPMAGGFDAPAETAADLGADAAAALRQRLKSCAALPSSVARSDKVKIVLRVALLPDGRLAQEPVLIEASASAKGPALMRGAMDALTACQPYTMLPADKYQEWKVLDLSFTPQDFGGG